MTRTMTLCIILASATISAQTPQTPPAAQKTPISVTGCVAPAQRDGSLGTKPTLNPPPPEAAAGEANNPEPTGRFMLLDAAPVAPVAAAAPQAEEKSTKQSRTSYTLRGHESELAKHVGHRVEVTGALMPPAEAKLPAQTAATAEGIRAVQVEAVKMIDTDCSLSHEK
jgi:hypothetical protein